MTYVYWLLDDQDRVLYVGITDFLRQRMEQHRRSQPWWGHVASVAHTDDLYDHYDAVVLEVEDIKALGPLHNKHAYPASYRLGQEPDYAALAKERRRRLRERRRSDKQVAS